MSDDEIMRLVFLLLFGGLLAGPLIFGNLGRWKTMLKQGAVWVFIFGLVIVGFGVWTDTRFTTLPRQTVFAQEGRIEVPRSFDGHYHVTLQINGVNVPFIVDTGASDLVLTQLDAVRVGLDPSALMFTGRAQTANGRVETARVRLDEVRLGEIEDQFVPAIVNAGAMSQSLLGMSYLSRFERIEIAENRLILVR